jgi:3-oxoacyl-[acyl-carrier-protein] synthase III
MLKLITNINLEKINLIIICTQNSKHFIQNEIVKTSEKFQLNGFELDIKWNCYEVPLFDDEIEWTVIT